MAQRPIPELPINTTVSIITHDTIRFGGEKTKMVLRSAHLIQAAHKSSPIPERGLIFHYDYFHNLTHTFNY